MENPVKKPTEKFCPIRQTRPGLEATEYFCLGDKCALYVKGSKQRIMKAGDMTYADPEHYYRFEGCGLIADKIVTLAKFPEKKMGEQ